MLVAQVTVIALTLMSAMVFAQDADVAQLSQIDPIRDARSTATIVLNAGEGPWQFVSLPELISASASEHTSSTNLRRAWVSWELASNNSGNIQGHFPLWLAEGGWEALRRQIDEAYQLGFRVVLLHRPFGEPDIGDVMDIDSRVELKQHPLIKSYSEFQNELLKDYPDLQLVIYIGSSADRDLRQRLARHHNAAWLQRMQASIEPLLDADRVHIAFDYASTYGEDSPDWQWICLIKSLLASQNREVVLESIPPATHGYQQGYWSLCTESMWFNQVRGHEDHWLIGNTVRWLNRNAWYRDKLWRKSGGIDAWARDCKRLGIVPCIDFSLLDQR